jgi:hypothetical protein
MTFAPKHVPYREALRIVAERVLKEGQMNRLDIALAQDAIKYEIRRRRREWSEAPPDMWNRPGFIYRGPRESRPPLDEGGGGYSLEEDDYEIRIAMAEIDRLWPLATTAAATVDLTVPADDDRYTFVRLLKEAIETGKGQLKKDDLERYFLEEKKFLPDGTQITPNMARWLATFSRSPSAMRGGNKRTG